MRSMAEYLLSKTVVVACIVLVTYNVVAAAGKNHLKDSNKAPVRSIKSPDGDIIDCIHIKHQPAFDHPLLKNHTIQMRPNYHPKGVSPEKKVGKKRSKSVIQLWHLNGRCPKGTIPIRRLKEEADDDISRPSSVKTTSARPLLIDPSPYHKNEYAIAYVEDGPYFGAEANINVWKPSVEEVNEYSSSMIWLRGGPFGDRSGIKVGWQVFPGLYHDYFPRFFTYLDYDKYIHSSCFNMRCSGFFQVSRKIALGAALTSYSTERRAQYDITIRIEQDDIRGHWWLLFGYESEDLEAVGYWVNDLFPNLVNGASVIQWGGEVYNTGSPNNWHTTTQMGSGRFPQEGIGKASYFWGVQIVNASRELITPPEIKTFATQPSCYDIQLEKFPGDYYFFYGGPGRNSHCP